MLSEELSKIWTESSKFEPTAESFAAAGEVAAAETAAKEGNGVKMLHHLRKAGKWTLDVSTNLGTNIATEIIKKSMGL